MVEILKEITTYEIIEKTTGLTCYTYQQANEKYRLHFFVIYLIIKMSY